MTGVGSDRLRTKIFNWQVGYRDGGSSERRDRSMPPHMSTRLVEDAATAYMAPEALTDDNTGEHLDVFSLGALAYHIFSGVAPASNSLELSEKLRGTKGLAISSVLNGTGETLQYLIQLSTHPEVPQRLGSAVEFLSLLDDVENGATTPDHDYVEDPTRAQIGDLLPGGYRVVLGDWAKGVVPWHCWWGKGWPGLRNEGRQRSGSKMGALRMRPTFCVSRKCDILAWSTSWTPWKSVTTQPLCCDP